MKTIRMIFVAIVGVAIIRYIDNISAKAQREAYRRYVISRESETGAERYFAKRLVDAKYLAAYRAAFDDLT